MFLLNQHPDYRAPLDPLDTETLGMKAAEEVIFLSAVKSLRFITAPVENFRVVSRSGS